jgi:hypothetical protein
LFLYNQVSDEWLRILQEEIEKRTGKQSWSGVEQAVSYQATVEGKPIGKKDSPGLLIQNLIFWGQNLDEHILKLAQDPSLANSRLEEESVLVAGRRDNNLGKEGFQQIHTSVKQRISESAQLKEFVEKSKEIHQKAQALIKRLEKEKDRFAKR